MEESQYVYELTDPLDGDLPFYVGISDQPQFRYFQHIHMHGSNPAKDERIQVILDAGKKPGLRVFEEWTNRKQAGIREKYWIQEYLDHGIVLTNIVHAVRHTRITKPSLISPVLIVPTLIKTSNLPKTVKGWLKDWEINKAWESYLQGNETIGKLDQFAYNFPVPSRIPILREKDMHKLKIWCDVKRWRLDHSDYTPPSF